MKPRHIALDTPIFTLFDEVAHTLSHLRAYDFLDNQAAQFATLYPELLGLLQQELGLKLKKLELEALILAIDGEFNYLCRAVARTLEAQPGGSRDSPEYIRYFQIPPSKLARPILGEQLATMRTWVPSLTSNAPVSELHKLGKSIEGQVGRADEATKALSEAQTRLDDHQLGPRKAFIDRLNALRLSIYGYLAALPSNRKSLNLPRSFAFDFFLRDKSDRKPSLTDVEQKLLRARAHVHKLEAQREQLLIEAEDQARREDEAEEAEAEAALAEAERMRVEAAARLEAARKRRSKQES